MKYHRILLAAVIVSAVAAPVAATESFEKVSVFAGTVTRFAHGPRNIAMGGTGAAGIEGFTTGYFNPASFAWGEGVAVGASTQDWILDISVSDIRANAGYRLAPEGSQNAWRFGGSLGYSTLSLAVPQSRTIFLPDGTGQTASVDDDYLSASAAAAWERGVFSFGAGGTAKYLREDVYTASVNTWAFDLGVIVAFPLEVDEVLLTPRAGAAVTNLDNGVTLGDSLRADIAGESRGGIGLDAATPPGVVGAGSWWQRSVSALAMSVDLDAIHKRHRSGDVEGWAIGVEASLFGAVQARWGRNDNVIAADHQVTTYGFGLGWQAGRWCVQLDYAHMGGDLGTLGDLDEGVIGGAIGGRF